jgi:hypothetical protein
VTCQLGKIKSNTYKIISGLTTVANVVQLKWKQSLNIFVPSPVPIITPPLLIHAGYTVAITARIAAKIRTREKYNTAKLMNSRKYDE